MDIDIIKSFYREIYEHYFYRSDNSDKGVSFGIDDYQKFIEEEVNKIVMFIIKGDFIGFNEKLPEEIETIYSEYLNKIENQLADNVDLFKFFEENTNNIFQEVKKILSEFFTIIYHFTFVSNHLVYQRQTFIETNNELLYELCEYCNLFILDYSIVDNIEYYEKLSKLNIRVKERHNKKPFKNLNILEAKLKFLEYKWLKRKKYNRLKLQKYDNINYSEKYIFNDNIVNLDEKIKIGEPYYSYYKDWINKIEYHYFEEKARESDYLSIIRNKDKRDLNSYDIYLKIKYYKDIDENIDELKKLQDDVQRLDESIRIKNELYYFNNLFSLLVKSDVEEELINREYKKITKKHKEANNNNFFIHYKYLTYLIELANKKDNLDNIKIDDYQKILDVCRNKFEWAKRVFNRLYDFDKKDCLINIQGISVYHPSAFSLPLSIFENERIINKLEKDFNDLKQKRNQIYIKEIENKIKTDEKKSIEIITVFTAIISFIVGSIGAFKFIESFVESLLFITIFGTSISIFVLLMLVSTKGLEKLKQYWYLFLIGYISIFVIICCLFSQKKSNDKGNYIINEKLMNKKIDSIYQISKKEIRHDVNKVDSSEKKIIKNNK